jgi:lipopolysaccharide export system permease protein
MLYNNLISVISTWVGQEKVTPGAGLFAIHGIMFAVMLALFYYRMSVFSFRRLTR